MKEMWVRSLGRAPRNRNGNALQYSGLENPMDRGAWQVTIHGVTKEPNATYGLKQEYQCGSQSAHHSGY